MLALYGTPTPLSAYSNWKQYKGVQPVLSVESTTLQVCHTWWAPSVGSPFNTTTNYPSFYAVSHYQPTICHTHTAISSTFFCDYKRPTSQIHDPILPNRHLQPILLPVYHKTLEPDPTQSSHLPYLGHFQWKGSYNNERSGILIFCFESL